MFFLLSLPAFVGKIYYFTFHAFMSLCVYFCACRLLLQNVFLKVINGVPSQQRNHRNSFYCHGKYFAKGNFRAPAWTSAKFYCRNKTGNPERAVLLHLARSGSQSQRGIWCILPAHGASHIIIFHIEYL